MYSNNIASVKWFFSKKEVFNWLANSVGNFDEKTIIRSLNINEVINHLNNNTLKDLNIKMSDFELYCKSL